MQMRTAVPPWKAHKFESIVQLMCHIAGDATAIPMFPSASEIGNELHDFLKVCFKRNPKKRPSGNQLAAHPFLALNTSVIIQEDNDPMMNTLAMIDRSTSFMTPKGSNSGSGFETNGSSTGLTRIDSQSSIMSDLSLSFSLIGGDDYGDGGGGGTGDSGNPFASDSRHLNTEGHVIHETENVDKSSNGGSGSGSNRTKNENGDDEKGGAEIRSGSMTTGSIKKEKKKKKKDRPLRPGKKRMAESIKKEKEQKKLIKDGPDDGSETMTNTWKEREEKPIASSYHKNQMKLLNKRNKAKEDADKVYQEEMELSRSQRVEENGYDPFANSR